MKLNLHVGDNAHTVLFLDETLRDEARDCLP
jgi:hypothetical protein